MLLFYSPDQKAEHQHHDPVAWAHRVSVWSWFVSLFH